MQNPKRSIFILSGQSNMAGRGGVIHTLPDGQIHTQWDGIVPPECEPHPCIQRMNANLNWENAREPLHADIDVKKVCGVGPGMAFANAVLEHECMVGLVPCAIGGTALKEWARGEELYENMVKRAKESTVKKDGKIECVLWYQGESDCLFEEDAVEYKGRMERFIMDLRDDLGMANLPIIQVALASGDAKYLETVRKAQLEIDIPNVICVDAKGLPLQEDNLHLSTEAQVKLGHMLAEAYLSHFASSK